MIFMNHAMEKMVSETQGFLELEQKRKKEGDSDQDEQWSPSRFFEQFVYHEMSDQHYRVSNAPLVYEGVVYNLSKYFITSLDMRQNQSFEQAMTRGVDIFSMDNVDEKTKAFLELLGSFYECEKAYVFYLTPDKSTIESFFTWTKNEEITVNTSVQEVMSIKRLLDWVGSHDKLDVVEASRTLNHAHGTVEQKILNGFSLDNLAVCALKDKNNQCIGVVGLSNRVHKQMDFRLLKAVTRFIQESFSKSGMMDELRSIGETDFLTGFYSRAKYASTLEDFKIYPPKKIGAVFININGLRKTNEYMGYAKGDSQIKKAADLVKDYFTEPFYRISGDEFVCFILEDSEQMFVRKVDRIRNHLKRKGDYPFAIGHAWKEGTVDIPKLVSEADTVMYINKQEYYHSTQRESTEVTDSILSDLLSYISNDEFLVYLQP